jgi:pimeloyl-ACP methyl ester carboxylesterase
MKKTIVNILITLLIIYIVVCGLLFFLQEKLIFFPEKLDKQYNFGFTQSYEELNFKTRDNTLLNGILFKSDSTKGLIFYLHGNAGALNSWGEVASSYTDLRYDLFMLDYRGFGKSEGFIKNQRQFYEDVQLVYDSLKTRYKESEIIILGYSIGTGPAANLASLNKPKLLILQAPYYSLVDMMKRNYPVIPTFLLKYKFETSKYIQSCKMPVIIFHGERDEIIDYNASIRLKTLLKPADTLISLTGQGHNGMSENPEYLHELKKILKN